MKKLLLLLLCVGLLSGCGQKEYPIISRTIWDNEPAICFNYEDGLMAAHFKLSDLRKLEMFLYDGGLDYTEELKEHKTWPHLFQGKRIELKKKLDSLN